MKKFLLLFMSVFALGANAQTYCTAGPSSTIDSEITGVVLIGNTDTISNIDSSCGTAGVQDFTATYSADISVGATYSISITMGTCGGNYSGAIAAWIDFNNDGDFTDSGEQLGSFAGIPTTTQTFTFTVPGTATLGTTRLRVMQEEGWSVTASSIAPCNSFSWGAVEDYSIVIDTTYSPTCLAPSFSNIMSTDSSATLNWNSTDTSFVIEYGLTGFANGLGSIANVNDTFAIVSGLSPNTSYDFYIKTDCTADTNGYSTVIGPFSVKTLCAALSTPLYESFDTDSSGSSVNTNAPSCWYYEENTGALGYGHITGSTWSLNPHTGTQMYYLYNNYDSAVEALISPAITGLDSGTKQMDIYMACTGWSSGNDVIVGTVSSPSDLNNFNAIDTISVPNGGIWNKYTIYFDSSTGYNMSDNHIAIITTTTNTYTGVYLDEINIKNAPQCLPPSAISLGSIGADSAEVNFTAAGIATYLEYGPVGFIPDFQQSTGTIVTASSSPHWLTGLDTNTSYDVYVYQMCADSTVSPAFGPATFKTLQCAQADMCSFDIELTDSYGDGWNGAEVQVLNSTGGVEYTLGSAFTNGSTYTETIMVCTGETFTISVSTAGSYPSEIGLNVISNGSTVASYTNSTSTIVGTQMAQLTSSCNTACPTPSNLTYTAGNTSAAFTFDQNGGSGTYVYQWGPIGFAQSTGVINPNIDSTTSNTFSISNLNQSSCYDVFIIANCGSFGVSDTLGPITFCTLCDTTNLCTIDIELTDSYGDGWNGAEVEVINAQGVVEYTLGTTFTTGYSYTETVTLCAGGLYTIEVSDAGSFAYEIGLNVVSSGNTLASYAAQSGTSVGTQMVSFISTCASCPPPSNISTTAIGTNSVSLSWTGGSGSFVYEYNEQGSIFSTNGTSASAQVSLSGLTHSTTYDFYVSEVCSAGDTTIATLYSFATDSCAEVIVGIPQFTVNNVTSSSASATFNWTGTNSTGFNISFGDGNSTSGSGNTVSHTYTTNGNYTVTLTVYNDCDTATSSFSVQIANIGIEDNAGITALMIYPNPTQGLVTIDGEISHSAEVSIRIINYLGQEILVDQFDPTSSVLSKTYDLSVAAAGAYLIEVATDRGVVQKSIIVRH